jgi:hypothetical protein
VSDTYVASQDGVALAAATVKTCLQIATPATVRAKIRGFSISFDGVTAANVPGLVEILRQTTAGTMTALTPAPVDSSAPASLATASHTATAEPTAGTVIWRRRITPNGGLFEMYWPDDKDQLVVPISGFLGIRCTFAQVVNVSPSLEFIV